MSVTTTFGERVRMLRTRRGISQADLAGDMVSPSYVSLIESGRRSPERAIVEMLARRLATTVSYLETGVDPTEVDENRLRLKFAELALANGATAEARDRFTELADSSDRDLRFAARWGLARAFEALGNLDRAVDQLESLIEAARSGEGGTPGLLVLLAQRCRLYGEAGDLGRSIDVGEQALVEVRDLGLEGSDDEIRLASTLVASYWLRGDLMHAQRLAGQVIERAEQSGSRRSRGAAYWNASLVAEARGQIGLALELAEKASALFAEDGSDRSLARLHMTYAWILLRCDPPRIDQAWSLLEQAQVVLEGAAITVDLAGCETELARCHLLSGRMGDAIEVTRRAVARLEGQEVVEAGRARIVLGLALVSAGEPSAKAVAIGLAECRHGAEILSRTGSRLEAAQAWREIAEVLLRLGRPEEAMAAMREVADHAGVKPATPLFTGSAERERMADPAVAESSVTV